MEKRELRQLIRTKAARLTREYIDAANAAIFERVVSLPDFVNAGTLFSYVSLAREPDTHRLIKYALERGKKVYVPRITGPGIMEAVRIEALETLTPDRFGILTPAAGETARPEELDFSLIPCLSAGPHGARLGNGGGYYDRFFAAESIPDFSHDAYFHRSAVLCFEDLLTDGIPLDAHDVRFGFLITEKRTEIN
ncbi:MAG: 5-formyltetrahydrofolate cyclo-ligase [Clostridia bacterium]|nr:5-formyltetrahydrofolate cyclo-ligase [Clostridia bacterium]